MLSPPASPAYAIDPARLAHVEAMALSRGPHESIDKGACVMEAVAWVVGEPFNSRPVCVSPVIGTFLVRWNDGLPDDERNALLKPQIPRLIGTSGRRTLDERRGLMCADWMVRVNLPAWLRLAGLTAQADGLADLPEITSIAHAASIRRVLKAALFDVMVALYRARMSPVEAARLNVSTAWNAAMNWNAAMKERADAASPEVGRALMETALVAAQDAAWSAPMAHTEGGARWVKFVYVAKAVAMMGVWCAVLNTSAKNDREQIRQVVAELQQSALALVNRMVEAA
jgi:hypothetical protein